MKQLFTLISLFLTVAVHSQDFKIGMNYGADGNVGEEIELKFEIFPAAGQEITATFLQFDLQWNNKLVEFVSYNLDPMNRIENAQLSRLHWDGHKFAPDSNTGLQDLRGQYLYWLNSSNAYPQNTDWSVDRYTSQGTNDINLYDAVLTVKFKILDRSITDYQDYSDIIQLNWARLDDNRTDPTTEYNIQSSFRSLSLNPGGVGAGDIVLNLNVPHSDKQDYGYSVYGFSQLEGQDWDGDGEIDDYYPKAGEVPLDSGQFDANGAATLSNLVIDEMHWVHTHIVNNPTWLDDVVTVTDVYKVFQFSLDTDINGGGGAWEYVIQNILGEVTNDGVVNFDDSYELLAHINGVETSANVTSAANGEFTIAALMPVYGVFNGDMGGWHTFTPTEENKSFAMGHGLRGDVDFSHSTIPTAAGAEWGATSTTANKASSARQAVVNREVETGNIDISSRLENGKVIVDVNLGTSGLVGSQFKIKYDDSILTLDEIVYDTGDNMTNFGTIKGDVASFGSLDYEGNQTVKTGIPYKLIFTANEDITNTAGLVSFKIIEGVKSNGTKVNFQF